MNKCQIAEFFDVSRPTVNDWVRRGCPTGKNGEMDPGDVATWRTRRRFDREGLGETDLPKLIGLFTNRLIDLDKRIEAANRWPEDMKAEPGTIKAAVLVALSLERMLLQLPGRVLVEAKPETLPEDIHRIALDALAEARGDKEGEHKTRHVRRDTKGELK
jgi:hypothetical protein